MECKQCGNEFEAKRATAKYCSGVCRAAATRVSARNEADGVSARPPCTPDQLTSSCLTCVDKPDCSYLHNMNSAVPGDADYAGVV